MLARAKPVTPRGQYTDMASCRGAEDLGSLVDAAPQPDGLLAAVDHRLREALALLHVPLHEAKSRRVDLAQGARGGCLGGDCRRVRRLQGQGRADYPPQLTPRTALRRPLPEAFRRDPSQPVDRVSQLSTPLLRGWVTSGALGDASRSFGYGRDGVAKKGRRHLRRARQRRGGGWKRWRRRWLYDRRGLFNPSRVHRRQPLRVPALPA